MGVIGITCGAAFRGSRTPLYDSAHPFSYPGSAENEMKTLYHDFFRILEWYPQFPLLRRLIWMHPSRMKTFLGYVRAFGAEISERLGIENLVEEDIRRALGSHYEEWKP